MKKITLFVVVALLSTTTICARTGNTAPETTTTETIEKDNTTVEILYFHGKQRCATCMAIEKETKALVEGELAQQVKDGAEDLTRFAFAKARTNAEEFRKALKEKVVNSIK